MLSILTDFARHHMPLESNGYAWFALGEEQATKAMPFWQAADVQRVLTNLREQGMLILSSAPYTSCGQIKFAFNERSFRARATPPPPPPPVSPSPKNFISPSWSPDQETFQRLAQHAIPKPFAEQLVPEFVTYWRQRNEPALAWGSKFMTHAIRRWRDHEAEQNAQQKAKPMFREWRPSEDAMEVLTQHAGIKRAFIEDAVPEFVLYWREQGKTFDNWNKKFRDHVQRQWDRYRSALQHDTQPKRIGETWQPSADVYEVLRLANIDVPFAQALIPEFVIYWRDSNQLYHSWNTRFLQYVKQRWAQRDTQTQTSTRDLSLAQQLTDRSWAD